MNSLGIQPIGCILSLQCILVCRCSSDENASARKHRIAMYLRFIPGMLLCLATVLRKKVFV